MIGTVILMSLIIYLMISNYSKCKAELKHESEDLESDYTIVRHQINKKALTYHKHPNRIFSYPTVGIPIPGNIFNSTKVTK